MLWTTPGKLHLPCVGSLLCSLSIPATAAAAVEKTNLSACDACEFRNVEDWASKWNDRNGTFSKSKTKAKMMRKSASKWEMLQIIVCGKNGIFASQRRDNVVSVKDENDYFSWPKNTRSSAEMRSVNATYIATEALVRNLQVKRLQQKKKYLSRYECVCEFCAFRNARLNADHLFSRIWLNATHMQS